MQHALYATHWRERLARWIRLAALVLLQAGAALVADAAHDVLLVKGHGGQAVFAAEMDATAKVWEAAAAKGGHRFVQVAPRAGSGVEGGTSAASTAAPAGAANGGQPAETMQEGTQLERMRAALKFLKVDSTEPVWLVLLGHGSAQGRAPKFLLEGPDLTADALAQDLFNLQRPVFVIAGFSASGAFLKPLAGKERIIVSATRSGTEENWTRFPRFFAAAISGLDADADADGQVSVLEAWKHATRSVEASYKDQGRLCTEHSALEDAGDGRASAQNHGHKARQWHLIQSAVEAGLNALQRERREEIELRINRLRERKNFAAPAEYASELEALLLELAGIYEGR